MKRIFLLALAVTLFATAVGAQDATVAVTAPEINPVLSLYEQARAVVVDAVLALGALALGFIYMQARRLVGEQIANQVRDYINPVMEKIVATWLGRVKDAQKATTDEKIKDAIIDGAAVDTIAAIPDGLTYFKVPLDKNSPKLRDMLEARITQALLKVVPEKVLASVDPHGKSGNVDLDATYVPPVKEKP